MTKRCGKCGFTKSIDDFHRRRQAKDGRQAQCKACVSADQQQRAPKVVRARRAEAMR